MIELLPAGDAEKWRSFHYNIYMKSQREGWEAALVDFMASLIGAPDIPYPADLNERVSENMDFFFKHEYKAFIQYIPYVNRIRENKVHMVAAVGRDSNDAYYVQSTRALASKLHCECIEFPGQHDVSFYMPEEFAKAVRSTLKRRTDSK
ncbi:hypothetical protein BH18THE2_BH18THE2_28830 [soil metagenome]